MNNLISKKWKIVKPVRRALKVVVTDDWKCSCNKQDAYYQTKGCFCYLGRDVGIVSITAMHNLPVFEHIVRLHNESLEGTIECGFCGVKYKPAVSHICPSEDK